MVVVGEDFTTTFLFMDKGGLPWKDFHLLHKYYLIIT